MLDLQNCQKIKTLIRIEIAAKADIEILARVEMVAERTAFARRNDDQAIPNCTGVALYSMRLPSAG
jgi:hypothetical protein